MENIIINENEIIVDVHKRIGASGQITIGTKYAGVKARIIALYDEED